jgi:hypothetical protein
MEKDDERARRWRLRELIGAFTRETGVRFRTRETVRVRAEAFGDLVRLFDVP